MMQWLQQYANSILLNYIRFPSHVALVSGPTRFSGLFASNVQKSVVRMNRFDCCTQWKWHGNGQWLHKLWKMNRILSIRSRKGIRIDVKSSLIHSHRKKSISFTNWSSVWSKSMGHGAIYHSQYSFKHSTTTRKIEWNDFEWKHSSYII